jgi:hypothetical protein
MFLLLFVPKNGAIEQAARQLCAAIAPILLIGAIAVPQPADLSRLDTI